MLSESWLTRYFYSPSFAQKILALLLFPCSLLYCSLATLNRKLKKPRKYPIPIISIGNLTAGGSGKTPLTIALAGHFSDSCVILRGYGRQSKGLYIVSQKGQILCDVTLSGDEAMLLAKKLQNSSVIVSEDRHLGIQKALEMGCRRIFLDDGFRHAIDKFDILIKPATAPYFPFCLPAGIYRESPLAYQNADMVLQEGKDFSRQVSIKNPTQVMILVTAIANPERLDPYLPENVIARQIYPDHAFFNEEKLKNLLEKHQATSILTTEKDMVKMENFTLPTSLLVLTLKINSDIVCRLPKT